MATDTKETRRAAGRAARTWHEREAHQREVLAMLRHGGGITRDRWDVQLKRAEGSRLASTINTLRQTYGFEIEGDGRSATPYKLADPRQLPRLVRTTAAYQDAYYASEWWAEKRRERLLHDGFMCVLCRGAPARLQVHHFVYRLFAEQMRDLLTVCGPCHKRIHQNNKQRFPPGIDTEHAERLGFPRPEFAAWLLPPLQRVEAPRTADQCGRCGSVFFRPGEGISGFCGDCCGH